MTAAFMQSSAMKLFSEARTAMVLSQPFFGVLALRMKVVMTDQVETMATDGECLFTNLPWFEAQTPAVRRTIIAHEVIHCANGHHTRRGNRDPDKWNVACDYAINPLLVAAGFTLWKGALLDPRYAGKSAEAIYAEREREAQSQNQQSKPQPGPGDQQQPGGGQGQGQSDPQAGDQGQGSPQPGDAPAQPGPGEPGAGKAPAQPGQVLDAPRSDGTPGPATEADLKTAERDWTVAVTQAARAAKAAGKQPGWLEQVVEEILKPQADWRELLRRFMVDRTRTETTWSRPNRRFVGGNIYLPGTKAAGVGVLVLAFDTSASTGWARELFLAEFNAMLGDVGPEKVIVVYCDRRVAGHEEFVPDDFPVTLRMLGGGGTAFKPVFEWIEEQQLQPTALVYLTDLEGDLDIDEPPYPVLWAVAGEDDQVPFGDVIRIDY